MIRIFGFLVCLMGGFSALAIGLRVGNGGGSWSCRDSKTQAVRWAQLADLFEAGAQGLKLASNKETNEFVILNSKLALVRSSVPSLAKLFAKEGGLDLHAILSATSERSGLDVIDDASLTLRPAAESCAGGRVYYEQAADYAVDGQLWISWPAWAELQTLDRGALLVHEYVYKVLRDTQGDQNSARTRAIVGLLFSTLPTDAISARIGRVLAQPAPTTGSSVNNGDSYTRGHTQALPGSSLDPLKLGCRQLSDYVREQGALMIIVDRDARQVYRDRFVSSDFYCTRDEEAVPGYLKTQDQNQCFVGYLCRAKAITDADF